MRPSGTPEALEARRLIAARLFAQGKSLTEVAATVGCSKSSASRWKQAWKEGGVEALRPKPNPGPKPRLNPQQQRRLRRRVWAPRGQTPVQYAWDRRDRITALAALTRAPWAQRFGLYYDLLHHNARTADVVRFLRTVHRRLRRPLLVVCDRLPAHRS